MNRPYIASEKGAEVMANETGTVKLKLLTEERKTENE